MIRSWLIPVFSNRTCRLYLGISGFSLVFVLKRKQKIEKKEIRVNDQSVGRNESVGRIQSVTRIRESKV